MIREYGKSDALRIWLPVVRAGSGSDVFAMRLAKALQRYGHMPLLQWFDHRYELMPWRLRSVVAPPDIDIVHTGSWQGFAFKRAGIPLIVTEHQYIAHPAFAPYRGTLQAIYHRLFAERCAKLSYAAADAVVAVSEYCATAMRAGVNRPVRVIHNWVDTKSFAPSVIAEDYRGSTRPFRLLFVGNPSRWKGADLLPAIADSLGPNFEIFCLGGLRGGFNATQLPSNMKLLQSRQPEQMPEVYRSVDAALVPTRYEAFGYVALEAMACALPVVGFNSSGTAEVCAHGETALLAPVDNVRQLVAYIRQLADDRTLLMRLGVAGRHRAVECFSEEKAIAAYIDIYRMEMRG
ncbi:MAG: glycosyltransferase family 4 protein [Stenotrophobium sp.]